MKYTYKTKKKRQKRINQKGKGILRDGIRVIPDPEGEGLKIPYIKKCPEGFVMCDQDEVNSSLCVRNESMCRDTEYNFRYVPPDNTDKNGFDISQKGKINILYDRQGDKGVIQDDNPLKEVKSFEIKYDGNIPEDIAPESNPQNLLNDDVRMNVLTGRYKSYAPEYHPTSCSVQQKIDEAIITNIYNQGDVYKRRMDGPEVRLEFNPVPSQFAILTQNALGLYRGIYRNPSGSGPANQATYDLMTLRTALFREFLRNSSPDFVCIQESTRTFIDLLDKQDISDLYPYMYPTEEEMVKQEGFGANATTSMLSKYPAKKATTYMLQGNSSYYNALGVYEFDKLIIFNVYMQAGSVISPGQKYMWENYARCRRQQLMFIKDRIEELRDASKAIIVLGDFNFELNSIKYEGEDTGRANRDENNHLIYDPSSSDMKWAEHKFLVGSTGLNLYDSYKELNIDNPDRLIKEGLTENTDINTFRYLGKLEKKELRYDGIFFNDKLVPLRSEVVNNIPTKLNTDAIGLFERNGVPEYVDEERRMLYNQQYETYAIFNPEGNHEATQKKIDFFRKHPDLSVDNGFELFVSDHFGVMTTFRFKTDMQTAGRKGKRVTRRHRKNNRKRFSKKSRL